MTSTERWDGSDSSHGWTSAGDSVSSETTALLDSTGSHADARRESWAGTADFEGLPWWKRPSVGFLLAPYALFTLAFGGSIVPKLNLIVDLVCKHYFADRSAADPGFTFNPVIPGGNNRQCFIPEVQKSVATFSLALNVLSGALSSLTAPKLGTLSDRYGRKRMMVVCSIGGIMAEIITIFAAKYPETVPYQVLLLAAFFDGLTGSFTAGSVLSHAYTSDCTPPSRRGVAIGYLHSCLFTGLAFGPLIAGYLVEWTGSLLSIFYILLGCHIFFISFMAFVTPESLSKRQQLLAREKYALQQAAAAGLVPECTGPSTSLIPLGGPLHSLAHKLRTANPLAPLDILFPSGPGTGRLRRNFLILAFIDMVTLGAAMSGSTVIVLYVEYMFEWGNFESSRLISLTSMVRVLILVAVLPLINYVFRTRPAAQRRRLSQPGSDSSGPVVEKNRGADEVDIWILRAALLSDVIGVVGYVFARSGPAFVLCAVVTAVGGLGSATIQSAVTKHVPPERVGQMLGAIGLLHALARIVSPIIFNQVYAATVASFPQAFFVLLASLFGLTLAASMFLRPHIYLRGEDEPVERRSDTADHVRQDALEDEELLPGLS